ncbi:MAG TPA: GAF domain-containing protein, partial [Chitinophagaceae bacterium]|nr:GAF domain-containing protein [Chitinophagaceae bacterium]
MYSFYVDGNYYVHQQGLGLYKMTNDSLVLITGSEFLGKERMQIMLPYPAGPGGEKQYLIGMFYSGLYLFDGKTFRPFATAADEFFKSGAILYKGILLKNGNYALGSTGIGLVIIDARGNLLQRINRDVGLQDESIYGTYEDKKGTLWLALDNGISRVETASSLSQFTVQSGINTGVLTIRRFNNRLYIGTTNGLLQYNNPKSFFDPVPGIPQNQIFSLAPDGDKLLVPGDGLFAIKDGQTVTIRRSVSADLTISALYILKSNPDILVTGGQFGVAVFTRKNITTGVTGSGNWNFIGYIPDIGDQVWNFAENKDGSIWAGTQNGVAYRLTLTPNEKGIPDPQKTIVEKFGAEAGFRNGLGAVYSVKGKNYFVGDSGLFRFDDKLKRFIDDSTFGTFVNGGLSTEFDMVEDSTGRVWIRAGKLTRLAVPKSDGGYRLDDSQLSSISELTIQKLFPEKNGILWVCTTDGLIRYDENIEKNSDQSFKTILRHVSAEKAALSTNTTENKSPVSISYKNNTLRFEYAAPFFEHEDKTQYQTWLEGFEKTWSDLDNNYYKEYTNLPSGRYTFHVRAKNIYGKQSEEAVYSFEILPPWYRTWWAYLLYAIFGAIVVYSLIRWRTRQLHEKHRELEKVVEQRTGELKQRVEELAVINSVQDGLAKELDIQGIYELVGERIIKVFSAPNLVIRTFDHETGLENWRYAVEKGERQLIEPKPFAWHSKQMIKTQKPIHINENYLETSKKFGGTGVFVGQPSKSGIFVPMIVGGVVKGSVSLQNVDKEFAYTEADLRLLTTITNSMSVALENARLFDETTRLLKETEQRTAELGVINSVQEGLAKELDMDGIYNLIGDRVQHLFSAQAVLIGSFDLENKIEHFNYLFEDGEKVKADSRPINKVRQLLIDKKKSIYIATEEQAKNEFGLSAIAGTKMSKSLLFVPLLSGSVVKGYVSLQNVDKENAFNDSDIRLLETLANSMSVALENARLFDETNRLLKETEQRTAELAVINSVQEGLAKELDIQGIYELVGDRLCSLFPDTQTLVIRTFDHEKGLDHFHYAIEKGVRFPIESRPLNWSSKELIATRKPLDIRTNYIETAKMHGGTGVTKGQPPKSAVFVPMLVGDVVKGSVSLQNVDKENAFTDSDLRLLTTITNSMSVALENARLFDETSRLLKETEQRTAELAVINSVQEGLVREMNIQAIYDLVGTRICELFDTQTVIIRTFDHRAQQEHWQYAIEKGNRLYSNPRPFIWANKLMIESKQPLLINENYVETAQKHGSPGVSKGMPPKSALFVPMIVGDVVRGSVSLQNVERENAF